MNKYKYIYTEVKVYNVNISLCTMLTLITI